MKVALIGFEAAGKSTLYRAAAGGEPRGDITAVPVPDERFDAIVRQVRPKKVTPATVTLQDGLDSAKGTGRTLSQKFIDEAKKADLFLHVVRAFDNPAVPYHASINPGRDVEAIEVELVLMDLQLVENRLERLAKSLTARNPGSADYLEKAIFEKLKPQLEAGTPVRLMELTEDEENTLRHYQLLSAKPLVVAFNVGEGQEATVHEAIKGLVARGIPAFAVSAPIEEEIAQLDPADQPEFLASLGLQEPASAKVIRAVYEALGLITFFTAGENETRAWPLRRGSSALKAAGTIHTDIAKGFIRAEVVSYDDYTVHGSLDAAYGAGKMVLQGKEYVIRDGDLLHIRNKS